MNKIYKYELEPTLEPQILTLPASVGSPQFLHFGEQHGRIMAWVSVNPNAENRYDYKLRVVPTGGDVKASDIHLSTVQMQNGLVWHVFRVAV